jgi:hypothetical protein
MKQIILNDDTYERLKLCIQFCVADLAETDGYLDLETKEGDYHQILNLRREVSQNTRVWVDPTKCPRCGTRYNFFSADDICRPPDLWNHIPDRYCATIGLIINADGSIQNK